MQPVTCIFCESTGDWSAALAPHTRQVRPAPDGNEPPLKTNLVETRSPAEARDAWRAALRAGTVAALVVEVNVANLEAACRLLVEHEAEIAAAPRMAVLRRADAACEGAVREAGATAVVVSPREIGLLSAILRRFAAVQPVRRAAFDERSTARRLRAALPWPGAAR